MKDSSQTNNKNEEKILVLTTGMVVVDRLAVDLPKVPIPGDVQFTPHPIEEHIGGHPANVAIDLVKLGMDPSQIGVVAAVGKDSAGSFITSTLSEYGVTQFLKEVETPTGQDLILVPKGQDRIFNIGPGANLELDAGYVKEMMSRHHPKILSIRPGYSGIDGEIAEILEGLSDVFVLLDMMKPYGREWDYIVPALKHASAIHCNDIEAMKITGTDSEDEAIEVLLSYGLDLIFITQGERGAYLVTQNERIQQQGIGDKGIDPTGAGDAFCAGVIQKLIEWNATREPEKLSRVQLEEMLWYAQAVGAAAATAVGTTAGVSVGRVQEILASRTK